MLTGQFGKSLFQALGLHTMAMSLEAAVLAEDYGRRSHGWSSKGVKPARDYSSWHAAYEQLADSIWASWRRSGTLPPMGRLVTWLPPEAERVVFGPCSSGSPAASSRSHAPRNSLLYSNRRTILADSFFASGCNGLMKYGWAFHLRCVRSAAIA